MNTIFENSRTENNTEAVRDFFRTVYSYMFAALGISGIIAYRVGNDPNLFGEYFVRIRCTSCKDRVMREAMKIAVWGRSGEGRLRK